MICGFVWSVYMISASNCQTPYKNLTRIVKDPIISESVVFDAKTTFATFTLFGFRESQTLLSLNSLLKCVLCHLSMKDILKDLSYRTTRKIRHFYIANIPTCDGYCTEVKCLPAGPPMPPFSYGASAPASKRPVY